MGNYKDNRRSGGGGRGGFGGGGGRGGGGRGGFGGGGGRSEMHQATCSDCGNRCEVPFKPSAGKPVFCNNCFKKNGDSGSGKFDRPSYGRFDSNRGDGRGGSNMHQATCSDCGSRCEVPFRPTGAKPVYCSDCFGGGGGNDRRGNDRGAKDSFKKAGSSKEDFDALNKKLDKILKMLEIIHPKRTHIIEKSDLEMKSSEDAKKSKPTKKKAPVKKKAAKKASAKKASTKKTTAKKAPVKKKAVKKKGK